MQENMSAGAHSGHVLIELLDASLGMMSGRTAG